MHKSILVGAVIFAAALFTFAMSSPFSSAADTTSADWEITAVDAPQAAAPGENENNSCDQAAEATLAAGGSCGGATCGKGTYCCNPSCARCVPFGMSCTQESCN